MRRICFILVAGLDGRLVMRAGRTPTLGGFAHRTALAPVLPAVTCTMQATLTTGVGPAQHGLIANGLYTHDHPSLQRHLDLASFPEFRRQISFWEQADSLLEAPRFWRGQSWRTAMLFWQQSMPDAAAIILTPKPQHTPDGRMVASCWSRPAGLYDQLVAKLGPFPLQHYWGPLAGLPASAWIVQASRQVWKDHPVDLQLVYVPLLDYNLQRLGPDHPNVAQDARDLDAMLAPLVEDVRASGGTAIIAGDYAMHAVSKAVRPNVALRQAGLLRTRPDAQGKLLIDFKDSAAVAMVDHQVAHVYGHNCPPARIAEVLKALDGVDLIATSDAEKHQLGLDHPRSGTLVLLSHPDAWFAHDWWLSDAEKPAWQFSVDIHRKPGYDPRELFFDPIHKCIAQDPGLVKGSHGVPAPQAESNHQPVLLSDAPLPDHTGPLPATACAAWLNSLLGSV